MNIYDFFRFVADNSEAVVNFGLVFTFVRWAFSYRFIIFVFQDENKKHKISMRARDINASSLTNAVSEVYYNGGQVPPYVRTQIIKFTNPVYKKL
jgi:hypothetical protein